MFASFYSLYTLEVPQEKAAVMILTNSSSFVKNISLHTSHETHH